MKKLLCKLMILMAELVIDSWIYNFFNDFVSAKAMIIFGEKLDHLPEDQPSTKRIQWWYRALKGAQ